MRVRSVIRVTTFDDLNPKLSSTVDATVKFAPFLTTLQEVWSANGSTYPTCPATQSSFTATRTENEFELVLSSPVLQNSWHTLVNKLGVNTFAHKAGV